MPLLSISSLPAEGRLALWHITEQPEGLVEACPLLARVAAELTARFKSRRRRQEYLAVRALLVELSGGVLPEVSYDDNGRPWLPDGRHVSFSHTDGYAAVLMSETEEVGVDIERRSERVARVARLFLRHDEKVLSVEEMLVAWSAKEAVYKLFSAQRLAFHEMRTGPLLGGDDGEEQQPGAIPPPRGRLCVENLRSGDTVVVDYILTSEYVLTLCSRSVRPMGE